VPPDRIWAYYAAADVYLQTPDIDNMPASVLEAFASGCLVVSTDAGGVPAILTHERHGLLVSRNDDEDAARQVCRLLDDPALASRLSAAARESCDVYRWSQLRSQWLALYRGLLSPAGIPATHPA
jgi:glycosyltransferase involved in cell wall biosynthesis